MDRHADEQSNLLRCRLAQKKKKNPERHLEIKNHAAIGNITYRGGMYRGGFKKTNADKKIHRQTYRQTN